MNVSILRNIYFTFKHNLLYSHKPEWKTEFIMLYTRKPYTKSINSCPPRGSDLKAEPNSHIFFQSFESWLLKYNYGNREEDFLGYNIYLSYNAHFQRTVAYRRNISRKSNAFTLHNDRSESSQFCTSIFSYAISLATVYESYLTFLVARLFWFKSKNN